MGTISLCYWYKAIFENFVYVIRKVSSGEPPSLFLVIGVKSDNIEVRNCNRVLIWMPTVLLYSLIPPLISVPQFMILYLLLHCLHSIVFWLFFRLILCLIFVTAVRMIRICTGWDLFLLLFFLLGHFDQIFPVVKLLKSSNIVGAIRRQWCVNYRVNFILKVYHMRLVEITACQNVHCVWGNLHIP